MNSSMTLYLYFTYSIDARPDGYSLYSIDNSFPNRDKGCEVNQPQLAVRIPLRRRDGMVCAKLGSKFYFLGGLTLPNKKKKAYFPTDVLVYDPTEPSNSNKKPDHRLTRGKPMKFGKSHPITFEVNYKLYVLGESNPYGGHKRLENLFEEYDPGKDCWKVLEGPPLEEIHGGVFRVRQSFVVSDDRVLITGNFGDIILSFDPQKYKWTKLFKPGGFDSRSFFLKDSFYGVWEDGGLVTKLGPCSSIDDGKTIDAPYSELSVEWGSILPSSRLYIDPIIATRAICHLFGRVFCTIVTGSAQIHYDRFLDYMPDHHLRLLNLIIYEEILEDPSCSKLKCLQQASFSIRTEFNSFGSLSSCYVVTPEEKDKRIQVDEKKIKTYLIDQSFQIHRTSGSMLEEGGTSGNMLKEEGDELKRVFLEGNAYLPGITMVVSLLRFVFDFSAFKNDIQFWNKNKSMEGLSAKSVVVSCICQLVVFLYLLDNETSWMILASSGIGCVIVFWKMGKATHIEIDRSGKIPMLRFRDRESYAGNKTKEYDDLAMKYLSYVLFFLVACVSVYSPMYEHHKSWYSWILSSLTCCAYMFGFIMMCHQLFINYKLKSVSHLRWWQMTYMFLDIIIDDLFAFVIKIPALHRLSVFRDDLIFFIYLYQRWIYPLDSTRVNEFGFACDDDQAASTDATAVAALLPEEKKTKCRPKRRKLTKQFF